MEQVSCDLFDGLTTQHPHSKDLFFENNAFRSFKVALKYAPKRGSIVIVDFSGGFRVPEMVKRRPCLVISKPIESRHGICTVVPLSTTVPKPAQPYHYQLHIPFAMPRKWSENPVWVKCDMVTTVGFHRTELLWLDKDRQGKRHFQQSMISTKHMEEICKCILHTIGFVT